MQTCVHLRCRVSRASNFLLDFLGKIPFRMQSEPLGEMESPYLTKSYQSLLQEAAAATKLFLEH